MKPYLAWPDNLCTVGRTSLWGPLDPDLMREILVVAPGAHFSPTFLPKRHPDWTKQPVLWEWEFKIRTEKIGDRSLGRSIYDYRRGFYVDLAEADVEKMRALFDIGPRGGPCEVPCEYYQLT